MWSAFGYFNKLSYFIVAHNLIQIVMFAINHIQITYRSVAFLIDAQIHSITCSFELEA